MNVMCVEVSLLRCAMTTESQIPDPNGPPERIPLGHKIIGGVSAGFILAVGGAAAFLALTTVARPTSGALRSQRLKWEERRIQATTEAQLAEQDSSTELPGDVCDD